MEPDAFDDILKDTLAAPEKSDEAKQLIEANKNIALEKSPNSVTVEYEARNFRFVEDLRRVYNFIAQGWGYKSMDHMIAILHTEVIAKGIADPLKYGPSALKAVPQVQEKIHPKEKISGKKTIPGDGKHKIIARLESHFKTPATGPQKPALSAESEPSSRS